MRSGCTQHVKIDRGRSIGCNIVCVHEHEHDGLLGPFAEEEEEASKESVVVVGWESSTQGHDDVDDG